MPIYYECLKNKAIFPAKNRAILMQNRARAYTAKQNLKDIKKQFITVWED